MLRSRYISPKHPKRFAKGKFVRLARESRSFGPQTSTLEDAGVSLPGNHHSRMWSEQCRS